MTSANSVPPAFLVPLAEKELLELGRFTAVWSQIDTLMISSIAKIYGISPGVASNLTDTMFTGTMLNLFKRALRNVENREITKYGKKFVGNIQPLIEKRNHIIHGLWGFHVDLETRTRRVAAYWQRNDTPIYANDLGKMTEELYESTRLINAVHHLLMGYDLPPDDHSIRFSFGAGPPQKWLLDIPRESGVGYPSPDDNAPDDEAPRRSSRE